MARKRWSQLSSRARRLIILGGTIEGLLKIAALVSLLRRPAEQVNGSKLRWAAAIMLVNAVGAVPAGYFLFGRRKPQS